MGKLGFNKVDFQSVLMKVGCLLALLKQGGRASPLSCCSSLEWRKLTGSGADCPEVTGVMLGHPF